MKNFLILLLIFISPLIIVLIASELLIRNIPNEYAIKKEYLDKNSNEIETLILGSSHTYRGVNPDFISGNVYNAAMVSQSLDYDYKILSKYEGEWDRLNTIVVPISYFSLYSNLENSVEFWRVKNYNIYYDLYEGGDWKYLTEIFSTPFRTNVIRIVDHYILNIKNTETSSLGWGSKRAAQKPFKLKENGIEAAKRHTKESDNLLASNLVTLNKILSFAKKNKCNLLFVTPPAFLSYREHLNQDQYNVTIEKLSNISLLFENAKYFNFIASPKFIEEDFYDADHLNGKGAAKFSKLLNNLIQKEF